MEIALNTPLCCVSLHIQNMAIALNWLVLVAFSAFGCKNVDTKMCSWAFGINFLNMNLL